MLKFAANLNFLFTEQPFPERITATADAGLKGIEFPYQDTIRPEDIAKTAAEAGVTTVLMNAPAGNWSAGERGLAVAPENREREFTASVEEAIRCAGLLACPRIHVMAGHAPKGETASLLEERYVRRMQYAADAFARHGIALLLEPINAFDMPGYFLCDFQQTLAIRDKIGRDNVFLQFDVYHAQRTQGDVTQFLRDHFSEIGHIQIADCPGRHQPGSGELRYPFIFNELDRLGYDGWIGLEYIPVPSTRESLAWLRDMGL